MLLRVLIGGQHHQRARGDTIRPTGSMVGLLQLDIAMGDMGVEINHPIISHHPLFIPLIPLIASRVINNSNGWRGITSGDTMETKSMSTLTTRRCATNMFTDKNNYSLMFVQLETACVPSWYCSSGQSFQPLVWLWPAQAAIKAYEENLFLSQKLEEF